MRKIVVFAALVTLCFVVLPGQASAQTDAEALAKMKEATGTRNTVGQLVTAEREFWTYWFWQVGNIFLRYSLRFYLNENYPVAHWCARVAIIYYTYPERAAKWYLDQATDLAAQVGNAGGAGDPYKFARGLIKEAQDDYQKGAYYYSITGSVSAINRLVLFIQELAGKGNSQVAAVGKSWVGASLDELERYKVWYEGLYTNSGSDYIKGMQVVPFQLVTDSRALWANGQYFDAYHLRSQAYWNLWFYRWCDWIRTYRANLQAWVGWHLTHGYPHLYVCFYCWIGWCAPWIHVPYPN